MELIKDGKEKNMKIIYNTNFLSKEEVEKIKHDNNDVEL